MAKMVEPLTVETARGRLDKEFTAVERPALEFRELWRDLARYIVPSKPRFLASDKHKRASRSNKAIVDNTATQATNVAVSGLLAGEANPSTIWFQLTTTRPDIAHQHNVRLWLDKVRDVLLTVFDRSNFYNELGRLFESELIFGTGAMGIWQDPENILRFESFPIGSFHIAQNARGKVDWFQREISMTVQQVVDTFGFDRVTEDVRHNYRMGERQRDVVVRHRISANHLTASGFVTEMPFSEVYWQKVGGPMDEHGHDPTVWTGSPSSLTPNQGILEVSGFFEFPIITLRWEKNHEEVWASRCPGIDALGDIRQLQEMVRTQMNGLNKMVNPPIVGGPGLEHRPISMHAGTKTIDPDMGSGGTGARDLHQVRLPLRDLEEAINGVRDRISRTFMNHIFLMLAQDARASPPTAEEVRARVQEKAAILGPVHERHSDDGFDPIINRAAQMLIRLSEPDWQEGRDGLLPQPPEELAGEQLRAQYVSDVAANQRSVGLSGLERFVGFVGQLSELHPDALDNLNPDAVVREVAQANAVPPDVTRSDEAVAQIRQIRAQQQQAAQMQAQAPAMAKAAKDLAQAVPEEGSVLDAVAPNLGG